MVVLLLSTVYTSELLRASRPHGLTSCGLRQFAEFAVVVLLSEDTEKPRHAKLLDSDSLATAALHMCLYDQLRDNYERYYLEASRATMFVHSSPVVSCRYG